MADTSSAENPKPRGFTNDGKVSSDIVNDSYGTVDPADSTGLDADLEEERKKSPEPVRDASNRASKRTSA
jgi:hypothetical protein